MPANAFLDPAAAPTRGQVQDVLGGSSALWDELGEVALEMGGQAAWAWGGRKYGWELRVKRGTRPFTTLTPQAGGFVALIVLGAAEDAAAGELALAARARATYDAAQKFHDGRWLFLQVETRADLDDVVALLRLKLPPTVRARLLSHVG